MKEKKCTICGKIIPRNRTICLECDDTEPSFNTIKINVSLKKFIDIPKFLRLVSKCRDDVVACSGHYVVNAKSLMGLLTLDLSKPIKVEFYGDVPFEVKEGLKKYMIGGI